MLSEPALSRQQCSAMKQMSPRRFCLAVRCCDYYSEACYCYPEASSEMLHHAHLSTSPSSSHRPCECYHAKSLLILQEKALPGSILPLPPLLWPMWGGVFIRYQGHLPYQNLFNLCWLVKWISQPNSCKFYFPVINKLTRSSLCDLDLP